MSDIEIGSEWIDDRDGDILKILVVDGIVLRVESKDEGLCTVLANDLLRNYRPKIKKDDEVADMVNHPPHYKDESGIECIEVTSKMQFCGGNCFKYLYRAGKKGSTVEDLKKAAWYANRAGEMGESYDNKEWVRNIREVARYRDGNISKAMIQIRHSKWSSAALAIKDEIARLESEAADD